MSTASQFPIDPEVVPVGDPRLDDALFDWVRTKLDVGGCQSLDELMAIAALGEKFRFSYSRSCLSSIVLAH